MYTFFIVVVFHVSSQVSATGHVVFVLHTTLVCFDCVFVRKC